MRELLWLQGAGTGDSELIGRDQIASLQAIGRTSVQLDITGVELCYGQVERLASGLTVTSLAPIVAVGRAVESAIGDRRRIALFVPDPTIDVDWKTFGSRCHRILTTERRFVDRMVQAGMDDVVLVEPNVSIRPSDLPVADPGGIVAYAHAKARDWLSVEAFCEAWLRSPWTERATLFLSSPDARIAECVRSIEAVAARCGRGDVGDRVRCIAPSTADGVDAMILRADLVVDVPITGCGWPAVLAKACLVGKPIMCTRVDGISSHVADASWVQIPEIIGDRLGHTDLPREHLVEMFRVSVERWPVDARIGRMTPSRLPTMSEACETVAADLSLEGA